MKKSLECPSFKGLGVTYPYKKVLEETVYSKALVEELVTLSPLGTDEEPCRGLIFRAVVNTYVNSDNNIVETRKLRPLLRLSCKGCEECGRLWNELRDEIDNGTLLDFSQLESQYIYRMLFNNESYFDLMDGYQFEGHIYFERVGVNELR